MNVWIKLTKKRVKCHYCGKMIETGEYQVVCRYYMQLKHSDRKWRMTMHFHAKEPYCWVERAITELELKPKVENRGGKPLSITDEQREKRMKILRRRASVMQRFDAEMRGRMRPAKLYHMIEMMEKMKVEIADCGGAPKTWQ